VVAAGLGALMTMVAAAAEGGGENRAKRLAMPRCEKCKGSGQVTCKTCGGAGSYAGVAIGVDAMLTPCPKCGATGKVVCRTCDGTGNA